MYVCLCNAINDKCVRQAVKDGAKNPCHIFKSQGCKAQCGKCVPLMREIIAEEQQNRPDASPPKDDGDCCQK